MRTTAGADGRVDGVGVGLPPDDGDGVGDGPGAPVAVTSARSLTSSGKLHPADEWMVDKIRSMLVQ